MASENDIETLVRTVLFEDAPNIRNQFMNALADPLAEFIPALAFAFRASGDFDVFANGNKDREKVAWLIFSAVQGHLISMRLFLDGFLVQSGNAQRQVLESIALAVLCSKPKLGFLKRSSDDKYKSNNAIRDVIRNLDKLGVKRKAMNEIKKQAVFYHQFSHPSKMTVALYSSFSEPNASYIGGIFEPAILKQYKMEAIGRVKLANMLPNFISGVQRNLGDPHNK